VNVKIPGSVCKGADMTERAWLGKEVLMYGYPAALEFHNVASRKSAQGCYDIRLVRFVTTVLWLGLRGFRSISTILTCPCSLAHERGAHPHQQCWE